MKRFEQGMAVPFVFSMAMIVCGLALGDTQTWIDGTADKIWSTNAANWNAGSVWTNGNSAIFSGSNGIALGEAVDISAFVTVANMTFLTNGYTITDADNDGSLTLVGTPVIAVPNAGDTGVVSEVIAGSAGFTKTGNGQLQLTAANTFSGQTLVSNGTLRLIPNVISVLGATGVGNETIVANGATLDLNGCYASSSSSEAFQIAGAGVDGKGALVNYGAAHVNKSVGSLTLLGDAMVNSEKRIDANDVYGNGHTLTKIGSDQFCVKNLRDAEIVINAGTYTLLDDYRALGGTTSGDTTMNAGTLNAWNTMTVPERITFNGGTIQEGNPNRQLFTLTGHLTLNKMVTINSSSITTGVEVAGYVDGASGFFMNQGWIYITGDTNTYLGPTVVNSGYSLCVGKTNLYSGVLGLGVVTNNGNLFGLSGRIAQNTIVNNGNLYLCTGLLSTASSVVNSGTFYVNRGGSVTLSNLFTGGGSICVRSNADVVATGSYSTNGQLRIGYGSFSLSNEALFRFTGEIQLADRLNLGYTVDPTNVTGIINVPAGCTLYTQAITFGNGTNVVNGGMTGILNQAGTVITTGTTAEENGIRLGHYPQTVSTYNMMAGTLIVGADYDLGCATDGKGWFNMTGGEVFTKRVMLNERTGSSGYDLGHLTVCGGTLNVGSLTGSTMSLSNAIVADVGAPYLVELGGGAGGTIRAVTNITVFASNIVYGAGSSAITYDTTNWTITISGNVTGTGGVNKVGSGDLVLSGTNTYGGATCIYAGTLSPSGGSALSTNSVIAFGVAADGSGGVLRLPDGFSLANNTVGVANPEVLDKKQSYTVLSWSGSLAAPFGASALPGAWYVYYDWPSKTAQLRAAVGTVIKLR